MKKRTSQLYFLFSILILITLFISEYNPFIQSSNHMQVFKTGNHQLYEQIRKSAEALNEGAKDAYIDRVWKKTPGRNGRKVNVDESYKKMQKSGVFDTTLLVFDETPPLVSI